MFECTKRTHLSNFDVKGDLIVETPEEYEEAIKANPEAILFRKNDLLKKTEVRAGELFSRTKIATDINAVADRYRDKGYAYVTGKTMFLTRLTKQKRLHKILVS